MACCSLLPLPSAGPSRTHGTGNGNTPTALRWRPTTFIFPGAANGRRSDPDPTAGGARPSPPRAVTRGPPRPLGHAGKAQRDDGCRPGLPLFPFHDVSGGTGKI